MSPAALLLALLTLGCSEAEPPSPEATPPRVHTEAIDTRALADLLPVSAVLEAQDWQALYFQQSGLVAQVMVDEGALVRRGQRLASLDTRSQENSVAQAEVSVRSATLSLAQAEHDLEATRHMVDAEAASAEQRHDAEQRVLQAQTDLEQAQLRLEARQLSLDQMVLRAPFDGVLAESNLRVGDAVRGEADDPDSERGRRPPMVVVDPSAFGLRASVPETQAEGVVVGLPARIRGLSPQNPALDGTVQWVAPSVDRASRTVAFRVSLDAAPGALPPWVRDGSAVTVDLLTQQRADALTVPDGALLYHRGESYVFVIEDGLAKRAPVTQGLVLGDRVEVRAGLAPGDRVAVDQLHLLSDGLRVEDAGEVSP